MCLAAGYLPRMHLCPRPLIAGASLLAMFAACGPTPAATATGAGPGTGGARGGAAVSPPAPTRPTLTPFGFRLPDDTAPLGYRVTLALDPGQEELTGEGEIEIERRGPGQVIYLRGKEITVESASLVLAGGAAVPLATSAVDADTLGFVAVDPEVSLPAGRVTLRLRWHARVSRQDSMGAFVQKTDDVPYLYSQFEPIGARRVFPCFDEPGFKVPWQLTLVVPRGQLAFSNTPIESQTEEGARTRVVFAATPPLPSYLIAFAVGPFEALEAGTSKSGAPVRVVVPHGHAAEATIPVEDTVPLLDLLEDYFGTPYPFAKLDLVPIPDTISFSAMENPGLITFSGRLLLTKPEDRTPQDRRSYAYIGAHEMAHMWFGDLVTMAWWDDLWLNEAFASWMGDATVHRWKPAWDTDLASVAEKRGTIGNDSRQATRRIREPVASENDVADAFDGITYTKGQEVIAMVEHWLGPDVFQQGIRLYLDRHARGSASYGDLIAALGEVSGQDVALVVDDFVDRTGAPFVRFALVCDDGKPPRVELTQRRFVPFGSEVDTDRVWHVPIIMRWKAGKTVGRTTAVLAGAAGQIELSDAPSCPEWIMPNEGGMGYYGWSLAGAPFERLRSARVFRTLPATERIEVASSVSALVTAGELPYRRELEQALTLINDPERQVRRIGLAAGSGREDWLPPAAVPRYRAWVKRTYGPSARKAGFAPRKGDTDDDKAVRVQLLWRMVRDADDATTQKRATRLAWTWLDDRTALAPEMIDPVLGMAAHTGDTTLYERLLAEARKANEALDKPARERFLGALGGFRDGTLVERTRAMVLEDEFPILETYGFLWAGTDTVDGREAAWAFLVDHYDEIHGRLPRDYRASLVWIASECTPASLERSQAFFAERTPKELSGPRRYQSFVESVTLCIARREQDTTSFVEFLTAR